MGLSTNKIRFLHRPDGGMTALAVGQDLYGLDPASGSAALTHAIEDDARPCAGRSRKAPMDVLRPVCLTCEHLADPLGLDETSPRLGWAIEAEGRDRRQSAYELRVAASLAGLAGTEGLVWHVDRCETGQTLDHAYSGQALEPRRRYWWTVRCWDEHGHPSGFAEPASFETGLMGHAWPAHWLRGPGAAAPVLSSGGGPALPQSPSGPAGHAFSARVPDRPASRSGPALCDGSRRLRGADQWTAGRRRGAGARLDRLCQTARLPDLRRDVPDRTRRQCPRVPARRRLVQRLSRLQPPAPAQHLRDASRRSSAFWCSASRTAARLRWRRGRDGSHREGRVSIPTC